MKLNKKFLKSRLNAVTGLFRGKEGLLLLDNCRFQTVQGIVYLTVSDMETTVKLELGKSQKQFDHLVSFRKFKKLIDSDSRSETIEVEPLKDQIKVKGSVEAKLPVYAGDNAEHFPDLQQVKVNTKTGQQVDSDLFNAKLAKIIKFVQTNDTRYIYNGVCLTGTSMVATDGRRLAAVDLPCDFDKLAPNEDVVNEDVVVHLTAMKILSKLAKCAGSKLTFFVTGRDIVVSGDGFVMQSRLLEGKFPDWVRVCPVDEDVSLDDWKKITTVVIAETQGLLDVLRVLKDTGSKCVVFQSKGKALEVADAELKSQAVYSVSGFKAGEDLGEDLGIGFDPEYLIDALATCDSEQVELSFSSPSQPVVIQASDDDEYLSLIMPMKL